MELEMDGKKETRPRDVSHRESRTKKSNGREINEKKREKKVTDAERVRKAQVKYFSIYP